MEFPAMNGLALHCELRASVQALSSIFITANPNDQRRWKPIERPMRAMIRNFRHFPAEAEDAA
jgi:hypothetical protein